MDKTDLADALRVRHPWLRARDARQLVDDFFAEDGIIAATLAKGEAVEVTGFGRFGVVTRKAEEVSGPPGYGGEYTVPAHRRVTFKSGAALRRALAAGSAK